MKKIIQLLGISLFVVFSYSQVSAQGCTGTASLTVSIVAPPAVPTISQNGTSLSSSSALGNQWFLNGSAISGATSQTYNPTQAGAYTVEVTIDGCSNTSASFVVTGISSNTLQAQVLVYPNPATSFVICRIQSTNKSDLLVQLINLSGQVLYQTETTVSGSQNTLQIPVADLSAGEYFLRLSNNEGSATHRVVVVSNGGN